MSWAVEPLSDNHHLEDFDCGNQERDRWLKDYAWHAVRQGTRTYVVVDGDNVVGYFSLGPHIVEREVAPKGIARGAPRQIPAILLAKLALDRRLQRRGLGRELLVMALSVAVEAALRAGGKVVVVDAIDDAAGRFYAHHDFIPVPRRPSRLVIKPSSVAAALDLPWPCQRHETTAQNVRTARVSGHRLGSRRAAPARRAGRPAQPHRSGGRIAG